ncbi:Glucoamylase (glucan-1,4-alpha-glucosidase), GH15 family [Modestobacter sp. DSM 44400]|uniref:glycoside hydrolase family 15 protein n=1 Tax=Modestobacter sp. DSM 44400 TaxID=1550230 RepID=UPI0008945182|nr:glycoside hydrolase family 15 protein [Modestobacter sp. DSM 44400]SDY34580.1 Glucoamylase (glucan-1,4-alpha-glucosidase), GH15 family [Modestobacter sp. DSM 44400]
MPDAVLPPDVVAERERTERPPPRRQPPIGDYGFLSDCTSAALVDRDGSVDWWCVPRFDSPSVFGRLLDPAAGHWTLAPDGAFESAREYVADTLVLRTVFRTATGMVELSDALAFGPGARGHDIGLESPHVLLRRVVGLSGVVDLQSELAPRMEYGRTEPHLRADGRQVEAQGGPVRLLCTGPVPWTCSDGAARAAFSVSAGDTLEFRLRYSPTFGTASSPGRAQERPSVQDTTEGWQSWAAEHTAYDGAFPEEVRRSSLVLQGLTYRPSGAVVAAATTSLPELPGGDLNFDYRFAWLRDLSLTVRSLWIAACPDEPRRVFDWFANAAGRDGRELVQIMYGVEGERDLNEHTLDHLAGYRESRPVRVGNEAWKQKQLDVFGEVLDAAHVLRDQLDDLGGPVQELLVTLADHAASGWSAADAGMWEARDAERHYTSSKVMCWVALDRALGLAPRLGDGADVPRWTAARDAVRHAVLERAWSEQAGAYTGAFDSDELDASVLILPLVGFLPATDERMAATIAAVESRLGADGLIRRWSADHSGFLICTYWLVECLALAGEDERARAWFRAATTYANDLGLLAEEADGTTGELLGNTPQAFSHIGLINAAWRIGHPSATTPASTDTFPCAAHGDGRLPTDAPPPGGLA